MQQLPAFPEQDEGTPFTNANRDYFNGLRTQFRNYLENTHHRQDYHLNHPGLNVRYGIELEFFSSSNKYVIANRVNSCIWAQNSTFFNNNFNARNIPYGQTTLQANTSVRPLQNNNNFNQWSSFYLEVAQSYHAESHKGDESCENRGNAGFRIERDGSVEMNPEATGISLWSKDAQTLLHRNTELKRQQADGTYRWVDSVRGLRDALTDPEYNTASVDCSHHLKRAGTTWNTYGDSETNVSFYDGNELVTQILVNRHLQYPNKLRDNGTVEADGYLPIGALAIDNLINHMLSHQLVIATQRVGFHMHLSESPPLAVDSEERKQMMVGFVKLFWLFEPLLFSFFPFYRSDNDYCQSIQSLFTRYEIKGGQDPTSYQGIWDNLVNNTPISGTSRKIGDHRYCSLNLRNCNPMSANPIHTVEVRLGHSTFDSRFIQAYVNILHTLFTFNRAIIRYDQNNNRPIYTTHNTLLSMNSLIPYYCIQGSQRYNNRVANATFIQENQNEGRPSHGFFTHCYGKNNRTRIIKNLMKTLQALTGCTRGLSYLAPFMNEYHATGNSWLTPRHSLHEINFIEEMREVNDYLGLGHYAYFTQAPENFNNFRPVLLGENWALTSDNNYENPRTSLQHRCKTCSQNQNNQCKADFNNGNLPDYAHRERTPRNYYTNWNNRNQDLRNEAYVFSKDCDQKTTTGKLQTELINFKTGMIQGHNYTYFGGKHKSKTKKQKKNKNKKVKTSKRMTVKKGGNIAKESNLKLSNAPVYIKKEIPNDERSDDELFVLMSRKLVEDKDEDKNDEYNYEKYKKEYERTYRVNEGADRIALQQKKDGSLIIGYGDWLGAFTPDKGLTDIVNTLLKRKIIDRKLLDILLTSRYIDYHIFLNETELHKKKLIQELGKFKVTPEMIEKIREVYKEVKK